MVKGQILRAATILTGEPVTQEQLDGAVGGVSSTLEPGQQVSPQAVVNVLVIGEIAEHYRGQDLTDAVVVSPDLGNAKTASLFARLLGVPVAAGSKVTFQKKKGKKWKKVGKGSTNSAGVAKAKFKGRKGDRVRAVFAGAGEVIVGSGSSPVPAATSKAVRVK